MVVYGAQAPSR